MININEVSVFVDESGSFDASAAASRYYLICMVLHNQAQSVSELVRLLDYELASIGLEPSMNIHCAPLIRRENEYAGIPIEHRQRIFTKMLAFARTAPLTYRCFKVDKRFVDETQSIHDLLLREIAGFLIARESEFERYGKIKVYYDNGQPQVTRILKEAFAIYSAKTEFVADVMPGKYRLFQVADLICTLELAATKILDGTGLSASERAFFNGARNFRRNILKPLLRKKIS